MICTIEKSRWRIRFKLRFGEIPLGKSLIAALLLIVIASALIVPSREASFTEWLMPSSIATPQGLVFDDQGNIWFAEFGGDAIGTLNPSTSEIRRILLPAGTHPWGITFDNTRREIWFTESGRNSIGRITSYGAGAVEEFPLTTIWGKSFTQGPRGITVQQYVNGTNKPYIWFAEYDASCISRLDPEDVRNVTRWYLGPGRGPQSLVFSKDIGIWFTEYAAGSIGNLNPSTGTLREWKIAADSRPWDLLIDSQNNVWYTDPGRNKIARFNTYTGEVVEYLIPSPGSQPYGIAMDSNGWVWVAEHGTNKICRYVPDDNTFTEYPRPIGTAVWGLLLSSPPQKLWFTDDSSNRIGVFDWNIGLTTLTASSISTASTTTTTATPTSTYYPIRSQTTTKYSGASTTVTYAPTTVKTSYQVTETRTIVLTTTSSTTNLYSSDTITVLGTFTSYSSNTVATSTSVTTSMITQTQTSTTSVSGTYTSVYTATTTETVTSVTYTSLLSGIPGFPLESIILGVSVAAVFLGLLARRKRSVAK